MKKVKLTTAWPESDSNMLRQTLGGRGSWGDCRFFLKEAVDQCDLWVVFGGLTKPETCRCAPERTLFIYGEPPTVRKVRREQVKQYATVWTVDRDCQHPDVSFVNPALPWHIGLSLSAAGHTDSVMNFEDLEDLAAVPKSKTLSVISSTNISTPFHVKRLAFVRQLQEHFSDSLDVFGRGFRQIADKAAAIVPYRYHITLENSVIPDYWTEKIADAYLGAALPIYCGAPNIGGYFPKDSFISIDIDQPDKAIETIETILREDPYESRVNAINEARHRILYEYNFFARIDNYANRMPAATAAREITLWPGRMCGGRRAWRRLRYNLTGAI